MTAPGYFDDLYATAADPWGLTSRAYERRKYDLTLASLPRRRYRSAFEQARARVVEPHVHVVPGRVPDDWPDGSYDLIVLSELMYYLHRADRRRVTELTTASLEPGGHLVVVDWRHPFVEAPTDGDTVHAELARRLPLDLLVDHTEVDFVLQVFGHG